MNYNTYILILIKKENKHKDIFFQIPKIVSFNFYIMWTK